LSPKKQRPIKMSPRVRSLWFRMSYNNFIYIFVNIKLDNNSLGLINTIDRMRFGCGI
jgi:hypothetical protein